MSQADPKPDSPYSKEFKGHRFNSKGQKVEDVNIFVNKSSGEFPDCSLWIDGEKSSRAYHVEWDDLWSLACWIMNHDKGGA